MVRQLKAILSLVWEVHAATDLSLLGRRRLMNIARVFTGFLMAATQRTAGAPSQIEKRQCRDGDTVDTGDTSSWHR